MLISTTSSFANISAQVYPILALFFELIELSVRLQRSQSLPLLVYIFCFLVIFLKCAYFLEIDTKMRDLKLKVSNKRLRKNFSAKPRFDLSFTFQQMVCHSSH